MKYREIIECCYCGNGLEKLARANAIFLKHGNDLQGDLGIGSQLRKIKERAASLDSHMALMGMGKNCAACAATESGGCCSNYMGHENTDVLQILMNLLAGVEVKEANSDGIECSFLGKRGCIFLLKPIFCLNYLCSHIEEASDTDHLSLLEKKSAMLLQAQVELEQKLIRTLQKVSPE